jgi:hypothetical protein
VTFLIANLAVRPGSPLVRFLCPGQASPQILYFYTTVFSRDFLNFTVSQGYPRPLVIDKRWFRPVLIGRGPITLFDLQIHGLSRLILAILPAGAYQFLLNWIGCLVVRGDNI